LRIEGAFGRWIVGIIDAELVAIEWRRR